MSVLRIKNLRLFTTRNSHNVLVRETGPRRMSSDIRQIDVTKQFLACAVVRWAGRSELVTMPDGRQFVFSCQEVSDEDADTSPVLSGEQEEE